MNRTGIAMSENKTIVLAAPPTLHAFVLGRMNTTDSAGGNPKSLMRLATSIGPVGSRRILDSDKRN